MAFTIVRLPNEPIIIVNVTLPLHNHLAVIAQIDAEARRIYEECGCLIYSIVTIGDQDLTFFDILLFIHEQLRGRSGSVLDIHIRLIAVNTHPLIKTGIKRLHRAIGINIAQCATVADSIAYARAQIAASVPSDSHAVPPST